MIIADSTSTPKCNNDYMGFMVSFLASVFSRDRLQISKYCLSFLPDGPRLDTGKKKIRAAYLLKLHENEGSYSGRC